MVRARAANLGIVWADKLDSDGGHAQVRTHSEVGNRRHQGDGGSDVVEDTV